jgi:predicted  nucleic acid-binding Zn-ribbon protein
MSKTMSIQASKILIVIQAIAFFTVMVACQTAPMSNTIGTAPKIDGKETTGMASSADSLVVVDCVLPPQVRKLGHITYMSSRRPVRSTAQECNLRGGEYVAFDRANLATALNVWLPLAKEGDPEAQTHVGEIFQKGINGASPDYAIAAEWFHKAADRGLTRAQINLGYLYEKGLGVTQDTVVAMNWYRKASGLDSQLIIGAEDLSALERAELKQLRQEVQALKEESRLLREQLQQKQGEILKRKNQLRQHSDMLDEHKAALAQAQRKLAQQSGKDVNAAVKALQTEIKQRQLDLQKERQKIATLQSEIVTKEKESAAYRAKLDQVQQASQTYAIQTESELDALRLQVADNQSTIQRLQTQLSQNETQVAQQQANVVRQQDEMRRQALQLQQARQDLANLKNAMDQTDRDTIAKLEARIKQQQDALAQRKQRITQLQSDVLRRSDESKTFRQQIKTLETKLAGLPSPIIKIHDPKPIVTRGIRIAQVGLGLKKQEIKGSVWAPAGLESLKINGQEIQTEANGEFSATIKLRGIAGVKVQILALDQRGKATDMEFQLTPDETVETLNAEKPPSREVFGQYHALVIGNINYQHLPRLNTAVQDAQRLAVILREQYDFKVRLLLNATRFNILSALNEFRKELTDQDNFLLFFAGHGELVEQNRRGYWLPVDADPDSDVNWLPNYQVTDILNIMSAKQILVIADACYSGALTRSANARLESGKSAQAHYEWLKTLSQKRSRRVLSSGELKPVLDSDGGNHSVFARALFTVLEHNDEAMEGLNLYQKVAAEVASRSKLLGLQQVPQYAGLIHAGHESGDFIFLPKTF